MTEPRPLPEAGLCGRCGHARATTSRRSTFLRCGRAATDPGYPRYPALPMLSCAGFEPSGRRDESRDGIR